MEILGIIATSFIIIAFSMNDIVKIRLFDAIGAILFIIYGFTISSFSTILLNSALLIIQLYKLIKNKEENK